MIIILHRRFRHSAEKREPSIVFLGFYAILIQGIFKSCLRVKELLHPPMESVFQLSLFCIKNSHI